MGSIRKELLKQHFELRKLADYIGESLADNYKRGLNGDYARRLTEGIKVATKTASEDLPAVAKALLDDRKLKGDKAPLDLSAVSDSESQLRAAILGLWSVRPVRVGRGGKIELDSEQVYGNHYYMPKVDLTEQ